MKQIHYFFFQALFFAVSIFVLHFALFDFFGEAWSEVYTDPKLFAPIFWNTLPLLILDLIVGIGIGLVNSCFSTLLTENLRDIKQAAIVTDIFWLLFCWWWYFDSRGVINVEGIGHLLSPFMVGFVGLVLALLNLIYFLLLRRANKQKSD